MRACEDASLSWKTKTGADERPGRQWNEGEQAIAL